MQARSSERRPGSRELADALSGGASGKRSLDSPGLAQQLAQETGLDEETAARSLQEAMGLLSQRS